MWTFQTSQACFKDQGDLLSQALHGLEKESLRVTQEGHLALSRHPSGLGDPMTHPQITTDFSESQLELITAPHSTIEATLEELTKIHRFVWERIGDEWLWPFSMPCILPDEKDIPIAQYGESPEAKIKEVYRRGLALRYGKKMQMISGVHYNFNFAVETLDTLRRRFAPNMELKDFVNESYLHVLRNFARHRWLLTFLFGASPALHESYHCEIINCKKKAAMSLRTSKCGYANSAEISMNYNQYPGYISSLETAVNTIEPKYTKLGLSQNGEPIQLNDHKLQIANEYYFPIRLKGGGRLPYLEGLKENGVRYIEVRLFDLNPFELTGVTADQLHFTQVFLTWCLLEESPPIDDIELEASTARHMAIAFNGRDPEVPVNEWAAPLWEGLQNTAKLMGEANVERLKRIKSQFDHRDSLPAFRIMHEIHEQKDFISMGQRLAQKHHDNAIGV